MRAKSNPGQGAGARGLGSRAESTADANPTATSGATRAEREPTWIDDASAAPVPPRYSENRIARDLVSRHESMLRYVPGWGRWIVWTGTHWRRDTAGETADLIAAELARVGSEMMGDPSVDPIESARERAARRLNASHTRLGVETFARADQRIVVGVDALDRHDHLLNTPSGTVDLRTGTIRPHRRDDMLTACTTVTPTVGGATFRRVLAEITCGDQELAGYLQRALGACLFGAGYSADHWLMFWLGAGRNGKNTITDAVAHALGPYARTVPAETLLADERAHRHPTEIANLCGVRLAVSSEIEDGARWSDSRLTSLTGDAILSGRYMRHDLFEFRRTHRHVILGNRVPDLRDVTPAIAARVHIVPFVADFSGARGDPSIPAKLRAEAGAILAWLIEGAAEYHRAGATLRKCSAVEQATRTYLDTQSTLDHWLTECARRDPDARTLSAELYASYCRWKKARGEQPTSQIRWGEQMARRYKAINRDGRRYEGITLGKDGAP